MVDRVEISPHSAPLPSGCSSETENGANVWLIQHPLQTGGASPLKQKQDGKYNLDDR